MPVQVMPVQILLLLLLLLLLEVGRAQERKAPPDRIGVIGAGIGGTAAAYFLRQKFGSGVPIDVFERGAVGGRLATLKVDGEDYEAGGDVIHPQNLYMKRFSKDLGLSALKSQTGRLGIFNGDGFIFKESSCDLWNQIKLLWKYGSDPLKIYTAVQELLSKIRRIYRYQSQDYAFSSYEGLLQAVGGAKYLQLLNESIAEALRKGGYSQKFIPEMVTPVTRFNYGQGSTVNGVVGVVSFGGVEPGLWSVEGGNKLVCSGLLSASEAQLISGSVLSVEEKTQQKGHSEKQYEVTYNSEYGFNSATYDIVVIAAPLQPEMANITFQNFNPPIPEFTKHYHQTVTTLVCGHINATFFGYGDPSEFELSTIFTMESPQIFFDSVMVLHPVKRSAATNPLCPTVWRVLSPKPVTKEQLSLLFSSYDFVAVKTWKAYPQYEPPENIPPIVLRRHLYYLNGAEWIASFMEMSAIAAKNAALLAHHHWYGNLDKVDQERLKTEL